VKLQVLPTAASHLMTVQQVAEKQGAFTKEMTALDEVWVE
jgi:hypothetical protein